MKTKNRKEIENIRINGKKANKNKTQNNKM